MRQAAQSACSNGNTYITESDISVPGLVGGLNLARTWNSKLPSVQKAFSFMFGTNWRSTYEERLIFTGSADGYLRYLRTDGSVACRFSRRTGLCPQVRALALGKSDSEYDQTRIPLPSEWAESESLQKLFANIRGQIGMRVCTCEICHRPTYACVHWG